MRETETELGWVRIRPYAAGDTAELLQLWALSMPQDVINEAGFLQKVLLDPNFDARGCLVAEVEDQLVGFILAIVSKVPLDIEPVDRETGYITVFFVHPDHRRQGIGSALVQQAVEFIRSEGAARVSVCGYPRNYFFPGPDVNLYAGAVALLEKLGFETLYTAIAMHGFLGDFDRLSEVALHGLERKVLEEHGVRVQFITPDYAKALLLMIRAHFNPDWVREARHLLEMYGPDCRKLLIAVTADDRVVGYCQWGGYEPGRFGPYGVQPDMRGKGIGKLLFHKCLNLMHKERVHSIWLMWTDPEGVAAEVYRKGGMREYRRWAVMGRTL
ncbi:MAG: GNAT family N-acetyltransferase [Anaerolineae bacterium]